MISKATGKGWSANPLVPYPKVKGIDALERAEFMIH
jgi:hypothetical protein